HRVRGERELNNGEGNPHGRFRAVLTISEKMMQHVFQHVDHLQHWCRHYGYRLIVDNHVRGYRIERDYRAEQRIVYNDPLPLLPAEDQLLDTAIETNIEWQLREIFADRFARELDREIMYGAQGGYIVPNDIAANILNSAYDDVEAEELVDGIDDVHSFLDPVDFKKVQDAGML
ncbi:MAG: hypothetical protein PVI03_03185, partial [Candidatus Thorarchaeota archaeon]